MCHREERSDVAISLTYLQAPLRLLRYARNDTKGDFSFIVVCSSGDNCCENRLRDDEKTSSVSSRGTKCRGDLVNMTAGTVKDCFAALALITCGAGYDK